MDLPGKGTDDELDMFGWYAFDGLLNDMVSILVFHTLENMIFELFNNGRLLICQDVL